MAPKRGSSGHLETIIPGDSTQPHLPLAILSIASSRVHGQRTQSQAHEIGTSYCPGAPGRAQLLLR